MFLQKVAKNQRKQSVSSHQYVEIYAHPSASPDDTGATRALKFKEHPGHPYARDLRAAPCVATRLKHRARNSTTVAFKCTSILSPASSPSIAPAPAHAPNLIIIHVRSTSRAPACAVTPPTTVSVSASSFQKVPCAQRPTMPCAAAPPCATAACAPLSRAPHTLAHPTTSRARAFGAFGAFGAADMVRRAMRSSAARNVTVRRAKRAARDAR